MATPQAPGPGFTRMHYVSALTDMRVTRFGYTGGPSGEYLIISAVGTCSALLKKLRALGKGYYYYNHRRPAGGGATYPHTTTPVTYV